jgi:hypothetical protein
MDERIDNLLRSLVAKQAAQDFILDYLLKHIFLEIPKPKRLKLAEALLDSSEKTEWLNGVSKDDFQAERLADMVVQMQQYIDQAIGRALHATERVEDGKWKQG